MALELKTNKEEGALTVELSGELNTLTAPELKALLDENLPEIQSLFLDFGDCDYVSSAGLRVLLDAFKTMQADDRTMELKNVGPEFSEVLEVTGLDLVFGCGKE